MGCQRMISIAGASSGQAIWRKRMQSPITINRVVSATRTVGMDWAAMDTRTAISSIRACIIRTGACMRTNRGGFIARCSADSLSFRVAGIVPTGVTALGPSPLLQASPALGRMESGLRERRVGRVTPAATDHGLAPRWAAVADQADQPVADTTADLLERSEEHTSE